MEEGDGTATTPESEPPEDWRRRLKASALCVVPIALLLVAASLVRPSVHGDGPHRILWTEWSPNLVGTLVLVSAATGVALLLWCWSPARGRPLGSIVTVACFAWCVLFFARVAMGRWAAPWISTEAAVIGPDGSSYRTGGSGGWDCEYWIVRDVESPWYRAAAEIVAGQHPSSDSHVIRPAEDTSDGIRFDASGRIYGLKDGEVLVAYDPRGTPHPPRGDYEAEEYRRRSLDAADVSPFALLSEQSIGADADVRAIVGAIDEARVRRKYDRDLWAPSEASLLAALDSPNPWIVKTAKRFIEAGGATLYPTATQRLPR